ncbi:unnamed protein product [Darwinula stevensoni]|uniref:J domain-containing protein n=1 Tax=Darwinula stevensoni TaxID=69355 RepID=A0A7R8X1D8_9CRUS|nr:unnamed protein product [Darwinula stevensoni]CAG0879851.1 unnamed protein product [Darwinula stevensoni]
MPLKKKPVTEKNLYELLQVAIDATEKEIKTAYRKKALKVHPDKNPNDEKAALLFHELSEALEILLDSSARTAYDKLLKAREAAAVRHRQLDAKQKKLKEDLEAREKAAESHRTAYKSEEERFQAEIERLRKEGSQVLKAEQESLRRHLYDEDSSSSQGTEDVGARLKVIWKGSQGKYDQETLKRIFNKYGDVSVVVISKKKKGSALIEMVDHRSAEMAQRLEKGYLDDPLIVTLIGHKGCSEPVRDFSSTSFGLQTETDFESLVMRQLRQAEERRKLIEEMKRKDAEDEEKNGS